MCPQSAYPCASPGRPGFNTPGVALQPVQRCLTRWA